MRHVWIFVLAITLLGWSAPANQVKIRKSAVNVSKISPEGVKALDEMRIEMNKLVECHRRLSDAVKQMEILYSQLDKEYLKLLKLAEELDKTLRSGKRSAMSKEIGVREQRLKPSREAQKSFELQYLSLQRKIQKENREYTMISNIMKVKHDTAKNSINNIR